MDIKEVKVVKAYLESKIYDLLKEFERTTETRVDGIDITHGEYLGLPEEVCYVKIKVSI